MPFGLTIDGTMLKFKKSKKDKFCMISLIFGIKKTKQVTKNNKTVTDTENKQEVAGGKGDGE